MGNKLLKAASLVGLGYALGKTEIVPRRISYTPYQSSRYYPTFKHFLHGVMIDKLNYIFYGSYYGEPRSTRRKIPYNYSGVQRAPKYRHPPFPWTNRSYNCGKKSVLPYWLVTFDRESDAESMKDYLDETINSYGYASVDDYMSFYSDLTGEKLTSAYTNTRYGWDSTTEMGISPVLTGSYKQWELVLPRPKEI